MKLLKNAKNRENCNNLAFNFNCFLEIRVYNGQIQ